MSVMVIIYMHKLIKKDPAHTNQPCAVCFSLLYQRCLALGVNTCIHRGVVPPPDVQAWLTQRKTITVRTPAATRNSTRRTTSTDTSASNTASRCSSRRHHQDQGRGQDYIRSGTRLTALLSGSHREMHGKGH